MSVSQSVQCHSVNQWSITQANYQVAPSPPIKCQSVCQAYLSWKVKCHSVNQSCVRQSISQVWVSKSVKCESVNLLSVSPSIKCQSVNQVSVNQSNKCQSVILSSDSQSVELVSKSVMSYWVSQQRVSLLRVIQSSSSWVKSQSVMQSICQSFTRLLANRACLRV